jgi:hypothetical protein
MKRMWIVLFVLAIGAALAAPASAAKPDCPGNSCNTDSSGIGMTCAETEAVGFDHVVPTPTGPNTFVVELADRLGACVDVMAAAGTWEIEVVQVGSAREVYLAVQDSVLPGDTCWGGSDVGAITEPTVLYPVLPEAAVDACGFGEADGDPQLTFHAMYKGGRLAQPVIVRVTFP